MWFMLASMALQSYSSLRQGQAQAQQYEAQRQESLDNARLAKSEARAAKIRTDFNQLQHLRGSQAVMGRMKVAQGDSGGRTDVGTNFLIRLQQKAESELDNFLIGLEGRSEVAKARSEKEHHLRQAGIYRQGAINALTIGKLGAATAVLGGLGTMSMYGAFRNRTATYSPNYSPSYSNAGVAPAPSIISGNRFGSS
jgi:hypothetical protein